MDLGAFLLVEFFEPNNPPVSLNSELNSTTVSQTKLAEYIKWNEDPSNIFKALTKNNIKTIQISTSN